MTHKELLKAIAPVWDEERQGVYVPLINKTLLAHNLGNSNITWKEGQELAESVGAAQPSIDELRQIYSQKCAINTILIEHDSDILFGYIWSSTEDKENTSSCAWYLNFDSGIPFRNSKYIRYISRAVVEIK